MAAHFHTMVSRASWRHRQTGRWYRVVCTARIEADQTPAVVYQSETDGAIWVRPLEEFLERFDPEEPVSLKAPSDGDSNG